MLSLLWETCIEKQGKYTQTRWGIQISSPPPLLRIQSMRILAAYPSLRAGLLCVHNLFCGIVKNKMAAQS